MPKHKKQSNLPQFIQDLIQFSVQSK